MGAKMVSFQNLELLWRQRLMGLLESRAISVASSLGSGKLLKNIISPSMLDSQDSGDAKQSTADMTQFVQTLLQQMQARFQTMSESIVSKIDEMGSRINELEQSINDLRTEMGAEGSPSPLAPSKQPDEGKPEEGSA